MAFISAFDYDIFISYAHVDNLTASEKETGWIEQFYKNLEIALAKRTGRMGKVKIWLDNKKLSGNTLFDSSIEEVIQKSAVFICLNSPGYAESEYCKKELTSFHSKSKDEPWGLSIGNQSRIFHVLLNNLPYTQWDPLLSGTSGFPFYAAKDHHDFGNPLEIQSSEFRNQLDQLRDNLFRIFNDFNLRVNADSPDAPSQVPRKDKPFTIFFSEVSDTLRTVNKRTISELKNMGFEISGNIPPPFEKAAHNQLVIEKINESDLTIHLLDEFPGKEMIDDPGIGYAQQQTELGLEHSGLPVIWVPADIRIDEIEEAEYKLFLDSIEQGTGSSNRLEYIRGIKSNLTREIAELAMQIKSRKQAEAEKSQIAVLLDTHYTDQIYAMELGKKLLEHDIQPYINPQEDNPKANSYLLADRVSKVKKLIFFYGRVSKDWVKERMNAALQLILSNNYAVEEFHVLMTPPGKDKERIELNQQRVRILEYDNSDHPDIQPGVMDSILKNIKGIPS